MILSSAVDIDGAEVADALGGPSLLAASRLSSTTAAALPDAGGDEDFVFGPVSLDSGEEFAPSSQTPRAAGSPLPPGVATHLAPALDDSLRARLLFEWRKRKRRRTSQ